jgi:Immunity protein 74
MASVSQRNVELTWDMRTAIAHIGSRTLRIGGESFGDSPDIIYMIYARSITTWDDGTTLSDEEKTELLDEVVEEAARHGWKFEIERP